MLSTSATVLISAIKSSIPVVVLKKKLGGALTGAMGWFGVVSFITFAVVTGISNFLLAFTC